jgi:predicted metalloprotease with PDZ domain
MISIRFPRLSSQTRSRRLRTAARLMRPGRVRGMRDLLLLFLAVFFFAYPAAATIKYKISLDHPEHHVFRVWVGIPLTGEDVTLALPAWNALYQVRDFSYRVRDLRAISLGLVGSAYGAVPVRFEEVDKQIWLYHVRKPVLKDSSEYLNVSYDIEWDDPGPFNSQLNGHHAFLNFAEILMYVPDRRNEDVEVQFTDVPSDWKIAAELSAGTEPNSFTASSYDALVDAPVEAGKFEEFEFDNGGAHFRVVVDGKEWDKGRLEDSLRRITGYELKLMGGPPFKEYTFFFHMGSYAEAGGGGMEHSNCTAISAGSMEGAAAVAAHELFHAWNVKRIRPQTLEPVDYTKEQYTRALWFAEGVTSTYGAYTLERSGIWSKADLYGDLAGQIHELQSRPAHTWQSVEESSLDAWLEKYDDYRTPERSISYYNKGQLDGVMLDLAIRDATDNRKSLDDVMRRMNVEYAQAGKFYNDSEGVRRAVEEVAGQSFEDFFRRYVAGVDEIPYDKFLSAAGLELKIESARTADLGFHVGRASGAGLAVGRIKQGSAAEAAGLRQGDVLLTFNGEPFGRNVGAWLREHAGGETVKLRIRRDGEEMEISYALGSNDDHRYSISELPHPSDKQRRIRDGLLHGTTD